MSTTTTRRALTTTVGVAWTRFYNAMNFGLGLSERQACAVPSSCTELAAACPFIAVCVLGATTKRVCSEPNPSGDHRIDASKCPPGAAVKFYERCTLREVLAHTKQYTMGITLPPNGTPVYAL